jgi:hypothetical protein
MINIVLDIIAVYIARFIAYRARDPYSVAWVIYPKNPSRSEALLDFS